MEGVALACLVIVANAHIRGARLPPLWPGERIAFQHADGSRTTCEPDAWLKSLPGPVSRVRLSAVRSKNGPQEPSYYAHQWRRFIEVTDAVSTVIWEVEPTHGPPSQLTERQGRLRAPLIFRSPTAVIDDMRPLLADMAAFAEVQAKAHAPALHAAIAALDAPDPYAALDSDLDILRAVSLPPIAARLLGACRRAHIFGGNGSWNDDDSPGMDDWGDRLYALKVEALIAATNEPRWPDTSDRRLPLCREPSPRSSG